MKLDMNKIGPEFEILLRYNNFLFYFYDYI